MSCLPWSTKSGTFVITWLASTVSFGCDSDGPDEPAANAKAIQSAATEQSESPRGR